MKTPSSKPIYKHLSSGSTATFVCEYRIGRTHRVILETLSGALIHEPYFKFKRNWNSYPPAANCQPLTPQ